MPKLRCDCGDVMRYGDIPCPNEWLFISDTEYDAFSGVVDAEELYRAMKSFLRCPNCGRLWVFWNGFASAPEGYRPLETGTAPGTTEPM